METPFTYEAEYPTTGLVPIREIAASLVANEKILLETIPLIEGVAPGLVIDAINVRMRSVTQESPLKQILVVTILATFQKDLEAEIPPLVGRLLDTDVHGYEASITVLAVIIAIYGIDFVMKRINAGVGKPKVQQMLDGLIDDAAQLTNKTPEEIRAILESKYSKNKLREIGRAAIKAITPSKREGGLPAKFNNILLPAEVVSEIPSNDDLDEVEPDETFEHRDDVEIELHAQDKDRNKSGWAGVLKGISEKRLKMQLYPEIKPEDIFNKDVIRGDVLLVLRVKEDGSYYPHSFHLKNLRDPKGGVRKTASP